MYPTSCFKNIQRTSVSPNVYYDWFPPPDPLTFMSDPEHLRVMIAYKSVMAMIASSVTSTCYTSEWLRYATAPVFSSTHTSTTNTATDSVLLCDTVAIQDLAVALIHRREGRTVYGYT